LDARTQVWVDRCAASSQPLVESDLAFIGSALPAELDVVPTYLHHDLKPGNAVCENGEVSGLFDLGEGLIGDSLEDLARPTWDLARADPQLALVFLRSYEAAARVRVPLDRLRDYVVLDLLVIWEYGRRPAQSWIDEPTFEAWATTFMSPVMRAIDLARTQAR